MPSERPLRRLRDIEENARLVLEFTAGFDFQRFFSDRLTQNAVERCLMRISEAGVKLGPLAPELLPSHDWKGLRSIGNVLRHDYDGVDDRAIWAIVSQKLPPLLADITAILARYPPDDEDMSHPP